MRHVLALAAAMALAACDAPSPEFAEAAPTVVQVGQSTFSVRVRDGEAEAIRTNMEFAPSLGSVAGRAVEAMETASGCRVVAGSVEGDAAVIRAALDCGT